MTEKDQPHYGCVTDGYTDWLRCGPRCDLQVVRPGKVQCNYRDKGCPDAIPLAKEGD